MSPSSRASLNLLSNQAQEIGQQSIAYKLFLTSNRVVNRLLPNEDKTCQLIVHLVLYRASRCVIFPCILLCVLLDIGHGVGGPGKP